MDTTITIRTDNQLKKEATKIFNNMGISLSAAFNIFLKQTVAKGTIPCSIEPIDSINIISTYPNNFFSLFGSGKELGLDEEPEDSPIEKESYSL